MYIRIISIICVNGQTFAIIGYKNKLNEQNQLIANRNLYPQPQQL